MENLSEMAHQLIYGGTVNDSYQNLATSLGVRGRDPRMEGTLGKNNLLDTNDRGAIEDIYRFEWVSKAIDIVPFDMCRQKRKFECDELTNKDLKQLYREEHRLQLWKKVQQALQWARLYGGAAMILHVKGHGPDHTPLDMSKVKKGQLERLTVVDRWQMVERTAYIEYNPLRPDFGESEHYAIVNAPDSLVHKSRIIKFHGREMPIRLQWQTRFWGESELVRIADAIHNGESVTASIANMVQQSNIDVMKVEGLGEILMTKNGIDMVKDRVELMNYTKSTANMVVLDANEEIDRQGINFTDLPKVHQAFVQLISGATDIPVTRLLGSSPDGENATGDSDMNNYYNLIKAMQEQKLRSELHTIDQAFVRSTLGEYPEDLDFEFNELWQETEEKKTNNNLKKAQTLQILQALGVPERSLLLQSIEDGLITNLSADTVMKEWDETDPEDYEEQIEAMEAMEKAGFSQQPDQPGDDKSEGPKTFEKNGSKGTNKGENKKEKKPTSPAQNAQRNEPKSQR